jgi:ATP-dependent Clp protease ATP-binding subunit ClpC
VAEKGYDVQFGARPLKRAIQTYIEDSISELIVNNDLPEGATIHINKQKDKDELAVTI